MADGAPSPTGMSELEAELKRLELEAKRADLRAKGSMRAIVQSPAFVASISALVGLIGIVTSNTIQQQANLAVERSRVESQLITDAITTGNPKASARNLLFLLDLGLIHDPKGRIARLRAHPEEAPSLPSSHASTVDVVGGEELQKLKPTVEDLARKLLDRARDKDIDVAIITTLVARDEHSALVAHRNGESDANLAHDYGLAFDVAPIVNGKIDFEDKKELMILGQIGRDIGLSWGGDFAVKEETHFELRRAQAKK